MERLADLAAGPPPRRRAVAVVSMHASPLGRLGGGENGGMNLAVRRLAEELSLQGVPSDVFVRRDDPDAPAEQLVAPGARLVLLEAGPARRLPKEELARYVPSFAAALVDHAASEARAYRLVHSHYWLSGLAAVRLTRLWRVPWVHSSHTLARLKEAAGLPPDPARAEAESVVVRGADRLVAVSAAEAGALVGLYGASPARVCVVPPGVDADVFAPRPLAPLRESYGTAGRRVVLYAGRLERLKGVDLLLDSLVALRATGGFDDVLVLCAGADSGDGAREAAGSGGERARLEARVEALGLTNAVRFLGAVPSTELAGLDALADVVAVPSMTETFGLVALEAQAAGTPVVATAVGGLRDAVADGVGGRLVEGRDPVDFAAALGQVLGSPEVRARLSEGARRHAERLTWRRAAERLRAVYSCTETEAGAATEPAELCGCL